MGPPAGCVWIVVDPVAGVELGVEVTLPTRTNPAMEGPDGVLTVLTEVKGGLVRVIGVEAADAPGIIEDRRRELRGLVGLGDGSAALAAAGGSLGSHGLAGLKKMIESRRGGDAAGNDGVVTVDDKAVRSDVRVLPIFCDDVGERFREFPDLCRRLRQEPVTDWPLEGPRTALWVYKFV